MKSVDDFFQKWQAHCQPNGRRLGCQTYNGAISDAQFAFHHQSVVGYEYLIKLAALNGVKNVTNEPFGSWVCEYRFSMARSYDKLLHVAQVQMHLVRLVTQSFDICDPARTFPWQLGMAGNSYTDNQDQFSWHIRREAAEQLRDGVARDFDPVQVSLKRMKQPSHDDLTFLRDAIAPVNDILLKQMEMTFRQGVNASFGKSGVTSLIYGGESGVGESVDLTKYDNSQATEKRKLARGVREPSALFGATPKRAVRIALKSLFWWNSDGGAELFFEIGVYTQLMTLVLAPSSRTLTLKFLDRSTSLSRLYSVSMDSVVAAVAGLIPNTTAEAVAGVTWVTLILKSTGGAREILAFLISENDLDQVRKLVRSGLSRIFHETAFLPGGKPPGPRTLLVAALAQHGFPVAADAGSAKARADSLPLAFRESDDAHLSFSSQPGVSRLVKDIGEDLDISVRIVRVLIFKFAYWITPPLESEPPQLTTLGTPLRGFVQRGGQRWASLKKYSLPLRRKGRRAGRETRGAPPTRKYCYGPSRGR